MPLAREGDVVLVVSPDRKHYLVRLKSGEMWSSHKGNILHSEILGKPLGRTIHTHSGAPYLVLEPSTHDLIHQLAQLHTLSHQTVQERQPFTGIALCHVIDQCADGPLADQAQHGFHTGQGQRLIAVRK